MTYVAPPKVHMKTSQATTPMMSTFTIFAIVPIFAFGPSLSPKTDLRQLTSF